MRSRVKRKGGKKKKIKRDDKEKGDGVIIAGWVSSRYLAFLRS